MIANYHTHTERCSHATGTEREYIERAIQNGIKIMGFSDHAPFRFPNGYESGFRVPTALAEDYVNTLKSLREEYKGKIKIFIGFEMEYYPAFFDQMLQFVKSLGAEYLILGQHFLNNELGADCNAKPKHTSLGRGFTKEDMTEYADCIIAGIKSGEFSYVAHPDVIFYDTKTEEYEKEMRRICKASVKYNVPLEINMLGIRGDRHYPNEAFWKIAGEEGCSAILGFDAHTALDAYDSQSQKRAMEIVEKYNLKLVETLPNLI